MLPALLAGAGILLVAGLFIFGGDDEKEAANKTKAQQTANANAHTANRDGKGGVASRPTDDATESASGRPKPRLNPRIANAVVTEGMSPSRRLLLAAAVRFTRWTSGLPLTDAHNGLRAMSRRGASALCLRQDRMAHASELVDQIRASGLAWTEVPVRIRYTSYSRGKGQRPWAALRILLDYFSGRWLR